MQAEPHVQSPNLANSSNLLGIHRPVPMLLDTSVFTLLLSNLLGGRSPLRAAALNPTLSNYQTALNMHVIWSFPELLGHEILPSPSLKFFKGREGARVLASIVTRKLGNSWPSKNSGNSMPQAGEIIGTRHIPGHCRQKLVLITELNGVPDGHFQEKELCSIKLIMNRDIKRH